MNEDERIQLITINLDSVKTIKELHYELKKALDFPMYYGMNWDAFWDVITGMVELPVILEIIGWSHIENSLPKDAMILKQLFDKFNTEFPEWSCEVKYK